MEKEINAVYEDDLKEILDNLELTNKITGGKIKCKFTNTPITFDNFHAAFPESGDIKIVCNEPQAIIDFSNYLKNHPEIL